MTDFQWTEVDGIATVWAETPPPLRAGLLFRTGRADETLVTAGQTHLIEHLAFSTIKNGFQNSNGIVEGVFTGFFTLGNPDDVASFLQGICAGLTNLPAARLEAEKQILTAEYAAHSYDVRPHHLTWRYGSAGHGLLGMPELGTRGAKQEQLQERSLQQFTRENAVLWLTGPVPASLHLQLPPGAKRALPALKPVLSDFPCWFVDDRSGGLAVTATVPRVAASTIFIAVANKRLLDQLRTEKAVSYSPYVSYEPLSADTAHLALFADSDRNRRAELAAAFGEFYEKLSEMNDSEVEEARKLVIEQYTGSLAPPADVRMANEAFRAAVEWLFGREFEPLEQIAAEASTVSTADVAAFVGEMQKTAILSLPSEVVLKPWMGKKVPFSLGSPVKGREVLPVDWPVDRDRLVHGPEGVSLVFDDGHLTVRYAELSAALHFEDGCVRLVSRDATWLTVEPTLWRKGLSLCQEICKRIPADLLLEQEPRLAADIPKPSTTAWQRFRSSLSQKK